MSSIRQNEEKRKGMKMKKRVRSFPRFEPGTTCDLALDTKQTMLPLTGHLVPLRVLPDDIIHLFLKTHHLLSYKFCRL